VANRRVAAVRAPRRSRVWFGFSTPRVTFGPAPAFNKQVLISSGSLLVMGRPTIARIRGDLRVQVDRSVSAAGSQARWAVGITTITDSAGVTSPQPALNSGEPWLWWASGHLTMPPVGADVGDNSEGMTIPIDSKSMRIVRQTYELIMVFEAVTNYEGVSLVFEASAQGRALVMPS